MAIKKELLGRLVQMPVRCYGAITHVNKQKMVKMQISCLCPMASGPVHTRPWGEMTKKVLVDKKKLRIHCISKVTY